MHLSILCFNYSYLHNLLFTLFVFLDNLLFRFAPAELPRGSFECDYEETKPVYQGIAENVILFTQESTIDSERIKSWRVRAKSSGFSVGPVNLWPSPAVLCYMGFNCWLMVFFAVGIKNIIWLLPSYQCVLSTVHTQDFLEFCGGGGNPLRWDSNPQPAVRGYDSGWI